MTEEEEYETYIDYGIISTNGQLTINKKAREALGIKQGDLIWFRILKVDDCNGLLKWEDEKEKKRMLEQKGE